MNRIHTVFKVSKSTSSDKLPATRPRFLSLPSPHTVPPARDPVFKHLEPAADILIRTALVALHIVPSRRQCSRLSKVVTS